MLKLRPVEIEDNCIMTHPTNKIWTSRWNYDPLYIFCQGVKL